MHAVVNRLRLASPVGAEVWARGQAELPPKMREFEGFESFYAVQVAEDEVVLVIVAETAELLDRIASAAGNDFMREHVIPHLAEPPNRQVGEVVARA